MVFITIFATLLLCIEIITFITMKFNLLSIVKFIFLSIFVLPIAACDDPYKVGLELPNANLVNTTFVDTFTVSSSLILQDKIYNSDLFSTAGTDNYGRAIDNRYGSASLGYIADPQFGTIKASFYSRVIWNGIKSFDSISGIDKVSRFAPIGYDSARIKLTLFGIQGDTLTPLTIKVEQLVNVLDTTQKYDSKQTLPVMREIGRVSVLPKTKNYQAQTIVIPLNDSFMQEFLAQSNQNSLTTSANFSAFMKGVKFSVENPTPASMLSVNILGDSYIEFIAKYSNTPVDTSRTKIFSRFTYYFTSLSTTFADRNQWFTNIETNYSNTPFLSKLQPYTPLSTKETNNKIYLQDGTGLIALLDFPTLRGYNKRAARISKEEVIVLNRAELYMFSEDQTGMNQVNPDIFFYESAANGIKPNYETPLQLTVDISQRYDPSPIPVGRDVSVAQLYPLYSSYTRNSKNYSNVFFTRYLQSVLDSTDTEAGQGRGIFMMPGLLARNANGQYPKLNRNLNRVIIPDNSPSNGERRLKLRVFYTKFKKR
jgi:hypothetical protein